MDRSANSGRLIYRRLLQLADSLTADNGTPRRRKTKRETVMAQLSDDSEDGMLQPNPDASTVAEPQAGYVHPLKHLVVTAMAIQMAGEKKKGTVLDARKPSACS